MSQLYWLSEDALATGSDGLLAGLLWALLVPCDVGRVPVAPRTAMSRSTSAALGLDKG